MLELGQSTLIKTEDELLDSTSRLILDKKTSRQIVGTQQVDLFWTLRREDELLELDKSTYFGQEDE